MLKRAWIRLAVTVRQSAAAIVITGTWLLVNGLVFAGPLGRRWDEAAFVALCIHKTEGAWGHFYASFTEVVIFGVVASMIVANATRRYRPEATSAALAKQASGHLVVIGYSNLGQRIRDMTLAAGGVAVVVEEDRSLVAEIIRAEEPLVLGNPREPSTLLAARVDRADVVLIATDDLEAAAVACRIVREANARCELLVRCADDDIGQLLAKAYRARALSASRLASRFIAGQAQKLGVKKAVILGRNNVGTRAREALEAERIACALIPETEDVEALRAAGVAEADLVVVADDDLGKNLVRVGRIRDLNPNAAVICRIFHEDAGAILAQRPFRSVILSTSRLAAETVAGEGLLRGVGVTPVRKKRA